MKSVSSSNSDCFLFRSRSSERTTMAASLRCACTKVTEGRCTLLSDGVRGSQTSVRRLQAASKRGHWAQPNTEPPLTASEAAVGVAAPVATLSSSPSFRLMRLMESLPSSEHSPLSGTASGDGRAEPGRPVDPDPGRDVPSAAMANAGGRGGSPVLPAGLLLLSDTCAAASAVCDGRRFCAPAEVASTAAAAAAAAGSPAASALACSVCSARRSSWFSSRRSSTWSRAGHCQAK